MKNNILPLPADLQAKTREERLTPKQYRNMIYEKFRINLRILRASRDLSAVQLAEILTVLPSGKYLLNLEYGRAHPKTEELVAISQYFGVTIDQILHETATITFKS